MDSVSTVSDRHGDTILIEGQVTPLRFLNESVFVTHQKILEETGLTVSETTFRNVLKRCKHIKTGRRERKTAVCRTEFLYILYEMYHVLLFFIFESVTENVVNAQIFCVVLKAQLFRSLRRYLERES